MMKRSLKLRGKSCAAARSLAGSSKTSEIFSIPETQVQAFDMKGSDAQMDQSAMTVPDTQEQFRSHFSSNSKQNCSFATLKEEIIDPELSHLEDPCFNMQKRNMRKPPKCPPRVKGKNPYKPLSPLSKASAYVHSLSKPPHPPHLIRAERSTQTKQLGSIEVSKQLYYEQMSRNAILEKQILQESLHIKQLKRRKLEIEMDSLLKQ